MRQIWKSTPQIERRGATTVEMAFAVPILFLIVFGLIEVGHAFMV
ncbi:MAG: pilus assembly protein, partial [Planctomycetia bacterium]|nr:pilus assembly protein [Planctomycetia bacterium]